MAKMRTIIFCAIILAAFPTVVLGELVGIEIPRQGWRIYFESPPLSKRQESSTKGGYSFRANSGRFNLSLFVEEPAGEGKTNKDCYNYYWPLGSRNPEIDKETIEVRESERYVRVQYDIVSEFQGELIRGTHINYYFAYRDKWIDVHISIIKPNQDDEKIFSAFDDSLNYGDIPAGS